MFCEKHRENLKKHRKMPEKHPNFAVLTTRLDSSRLRVEIRKLLDSTRLNRILLIRLAFLIRLDLSQVEIESILLDSTSSRFDSTFDLSRLDFRLESTRPDDIFFHRF